MQFLHYKWYIRWRKSWYTWECSQWSACNYTRKAQIAPSPPRCNWDCKRDRIWNALENALKNGFKSANGCKIWPIKNENISKRFSTPVNVQESANGTTINACDVRSMVRFRVHLIIHLELHLKVPFKICIKMYKKIYLRMY